MECEPAMTYDLEGYRQLQQLRLAPTAGGESFTCPEEFDPFLQSGAYGVAQPDAAVVGGRAAVLKSSGAPGNAGFRLPYTPGRPEWDWPKISKPAAA